MPGGSWRTPHRRADPHTAPPVHAGPTRRLDGCGGDPALAPAPHPEQSSAVRHAAAEQCRLGGGAHALEDPMTDGSGVRMEASVGVHRATPRRRPLRTGLVVVELDAVDPIDGDVHRDRVPVSY